MAKSKRRNEERRPTRDEKVDRSWQPAPPLEGLNQKQRDYIHAIENFPFVVATGYAGTSKTYIPTRIAARWLAQDAIKEIIIARPAASMSESLGYFKGDHLEKMKMWIAPVLGALREDISPTALEYYMQEETCRIRCVPMETIKGMSLKDAFVIVDEAEDCTFKEIKSLLTRLGENSTMVLAGDITQADIGQSGLGKLLEIWDVNENIHDVVEVVDFNDYDDIVRSEPVKKIIIGLDEYEAAA